MSYKFAFSIKKCAFCCTFFCFRAQSYEFFPKFASDFSINKLKIEEGRLKKTKNAAFVFKDCKMKIAF